MFRQLKRSVSVVVVAATMWALLGAVAGAGPIFLPGEMNDGKFVPDKEAASPCYRVQYSTITASVDGLTAHVKVQETVAGPSDAVKTVCLIPLPKGVRASGTFVAAGIPNEDHAVLRGAKYLGPKEAQKAYEAIAESLGSVKILALSDQPAMLVPEFELKGKVEMVVQFEQEIASKHGVRWLECPMPATDWTSGPVSRVSISANVTSGLPVRAMFSPTHEAKIERKNLNEVVARVRADDHKTTDDFRLCWVASLDALGMRALAYRGEGEGNNSGEGNNDGYFMLLGNPTGSPDDEAIAKDVVFVLDTSGSMRGEKIEQARAAIEYCLEQLNDGDRFNIVTFGTDVSSFRDGPVARSEQTVDAAQTFIEEVVAKGRTNISGALAKALAGKSEAGRPRITIFLTDGTPTAGQLVPEKIVEEVKKVTPCPTRIFVMGVGHDVNAHLLDKLAEVTDGSSEYVEPNEEIDAKVAALYDRLSHPVLTDVQVAFGDLKTHSVYPAKLPALFKNSEVMVFGRYREGGKHTLKISGMLAGKPTSYTCTAEFPEKASGETNEFVAPLWAARKIGYLLKEIRLHGENDELIAEVVRLSTEFGIVTEYTEHIASATTDVSHAVAVTEAKRRMKTANAQQSGKWAVNQARNDSELQNRMVATKGGNNYRDRRGNVVSNDNLQQIGSQVFYNRGGQWVEAAEAGNRKTRVVKLFSPEYKELLRNNKQFSRAQKLGWAMSINVGDERIVVERDGQQKSPELQQRAPQQDIPRQNIQQNLPRNMQQNLQQRNILQQQELNQVPLRQNRGDLQLQQINQIPRNNLRNLPLNRERRAVQPANEDLNQLNRRNRNLNRIPVQNEVFNENQLPDFVCNDLGNLRDIDQQNANQP